MTFFGWTFVDVAMFGEMTSSVSSEKTEAERRKTKGTVSAPARVERRKKEQVEKERERERELEGQRSVFGCCGCTVCRRTRAWGKRNDLEQRLKEKKKGNDFLNFQPLQKGNKSKETTWGNDCQRLSQVVILDPKKTKLRGLVQKKRKRQIKKVVLITDSVCTNARDSKCRVRNRVILVL